MSGTTTAGIGYFDDLIAAQKNQAPRYFDDLIPAQQNAAAAPSSGGGFTIVDSLPPSGRGFTIVDSLPPAGNAQPTGSGSLFRQVLGSILPGGQYMPDIAYGAKRTLDAAAQLAARGATTLDPTSQTFANMQQATEAANADTKAAQPAPIPGSGFAQDLAPGLAWPFKAAGIFGSIVQGAGAGGLGGALTPVDNPGDNFWTQKAKQVGMGTVVGAGVGGTLRTVAGALSPQIGAAQQKLIDENISLTPGQALGGIPNALESAATSIPVLGSIIGGARQQGILDLNRAVYARALQPFGDEGAQVAASVPVGTKGIKAVGNFLSQKYEDALSQSVPAPFDDQTQSALANLSTMVPSSMKSDFDSAIQRNVLDNITPAGTITPTVGKQADSALGQLAATYRGSSDGSQRLYSQALSQAQSTIKDMFARANPQTAPIIQAADQGWATLVQLEKAGQSIGAMGQDGVFTPAQLTNAVRGSDNTVRNRMSARGDALNQDLSTAAQQVLPNKVNNSGTFDRAAAVMSLPALAEGFMHAPMTTSVGLGAGGLASLLYTPAGKQVALSMLTKRPDLARQLGTALSSLAIPAAGVAGASGPRL